MRVGRGASQMAKAAMGTTWRVHEILLVALLTLCPCSIHSICACLVVADPCFLHGATRHAGLIADPDQLGSHIAGLTLPAGIDHGGGEGPGEGADEVH